MSEISFDRLVDMKIDTWTAMWSDDLDAPRRDEETYRNALASQSVFTDEEIGAEAGRRMSGESKIA